MNRSLSSIMILVILAASLLVTQAQARQDDLPPVSPSLLEGVTTLVSIASDGTQGNKLSYHPSISADGRYIAFESNASNLVANDTNGDPDVFVYDRLTGQTRRVSRASNGTQGNNGSGTPAISADGLTVAFVSAATNLASVDTNGVNDVFVHEQETGKTKRVSVATNGAQGDGASQEPSISSDGRLVAFSSEATNLVSGDTNGVQDIFIHNQAKGETKRISLSSSGAQGNELSRHACISADGRYVAFESAASNLVNGDTNGSFDIFVHERGSGVTRRVSIASDGTQGKKSSINPSISADGRYVAFESNANNLVSEDTNIYADVFVHDRLTGETTRVSIASNGTQGNEDSRSPAISADGRYVAFASAASNLVSGDANSSVDIFIHDRVTRQTRRVSVASDGTEANLYSKEPVISASGIYIAFESYASNLVSGDTNGAGDVFLHDLLGLPANKIYIPIASK